MKMTKRIVAWILTLCMILPVIPFTAPAHAATAYRYELDTDGIDAGATYLIASASSGSVNLLKFHYSGMFNRDFQNQSGVSVSQEDGKPVIATGFTGEEDCTFVFSAATSGTISHGSYKVDLADSGFTSYSPDTLTFSHQGSGRYRIYYSSWGTVRYLRYSGSWARSTTASDVYLFKLVEYDTGVDVIYDGNGYTEGVLPQSSFSLEKGGTYTVQAPQEELRMDVGEDTWLFRCWNTSATGTGEDYLPGESFTLSEDVTLYAQWILQTKYTVTVLTDLDGAPADIEALHGEGAELYIRSDAEGAEYIPLIHRETGVYSVKVTENGSYGVFIKHDGEYEEAHGHKVVIFNGDSSTELLNYTVSYDANGGAFAEGEAPEDAVYHANTRVTATDKVPTREGFRFLGWVDTDGNTFAPGEVVTEALLKKTVLTAQWEELVSVSLSVRLEHVSEDGTATDTEEGFGSVELTLMRRKETGVNVPVQTLVLTPDSHDGFDYSYDEASGVTVYTPNRATFENMIPGTYTVIFAKHHYEKVAQTLQADAEGNLILTAAARYFPTDFDLDFKVEVKDWESVPEELRPQAVNLRVIRWGENENGELGWHTISRQADGKPPVSVALDENGKGEGFIPVWQSRGENGELYYYRVKVSSFVMPDGKILVTEGDDYVTYIGGIYTATVGFDGQAQIPTYPAPSQLGGVHYADNAFEQSAILAVSVGVTPFTVSFDAGEGILNGESTVVLENQYRYPDLATYLPTPPADTSFAGWQVGGEFAENLSGQYLTGSVAYVAKYNPGITVSGTVTVAGTYELGGETVNFNEIDLIKEVSVVLQKNVNGVWNDVEGTVVSVSYVPDAEGKLVGTGAYLFEEIPNNGTGYRIVVYGTNYTAEFDNNGDGVFGQEQEAVVDVAAGTAVVDANLALTPETYNAWISVDASLIEESMRPDSALAQILYRDPGNIHNYKVIAQHANAPYGVPVELDEEGKGSGFEDVWIRHNNGNYYEYQVSLFKLFGTVQGVYEEEGTAVNINSPFRVEYGIPGSYLNEAGGTHDLRAKLIPKEYPIFFDMNLGEDTETPILGMEQYHLDSDGEGDVYAYMHTWSYADHIQATPYRRGYVFLGWEVDESTGIVASELGDVAIGADIAQPVTLKAIWGDLEGTDYTVRHLELNTDRVLHRAEMVSGAANGSVVYAGDRVRVIEGYAYAGAYVDGVYVDKEEDPSLTVGTDPAQNVLVIYYSPDGSDGYTDQVEGNLKLNKEAVLEDNGTYTITLDTYTMDNPITALVEQNTPLDIVLVLDQSGSLYENNAEYLNALEDAVDNFTELIADHGRTNEVDHRIALVGFSCDEDDIPTADNYPYTGQGVVTDANQRPDSWINTGFFDSNGVFYRYHIKGFHYTAYDGVPDLNGAYYTWAADTEEYLLLTHHDTYYHLIDEEGARQEDLRGNTVYGYADGAFVELTRNTSGLWLYGDKQLYSLTEFFTYHEDVWTHRSGVQPRQIHAYGQGASYAPVDGHEGVYTRTETTETSGDSSYQSIYDDALIPVSVGANGSGSTNPVLLNASHKLGANGATRTSYGVEMANNIFAANPLDPEEGRVRIMVLFTDGEPGFRGFDETSADYYNQAITEANAAISNAWESKNTHGAHVFTIGLYKKSAIHESGYQSVFMNAVSSNYPDAKSLDDVLNTLYSPAPANSYLYSGGPYYVYAQGGYRRLSWSNSRWVFTNSSGGTTSVSSSYYARVSSSGTVGSYTIYKAGTPDGSAGYYSTTENADELKTYFENVVKEITTKTTYEMVLDQDAILRDIMNQGLVLTPGSVVTVYTQAGTYNAETEGIDWATAGDGSALLTERVALTVGEGTTATDPETGITINVYNLDAANATDPDAAEYAPHTVDVSGYNFSEWYINESSPSGYKMVVKITRVEARDDVEWGRSTFTNNAKSGMWLPLNEEGERQLLLAFEQPTTIFVERAYVLDYGKEFTLGGWYFDDEDGKEATPIHLDANIADGMNWFDPASPNTANSKGNEYGNTLYGNVHFEDGQVHYVPTTSHWDGFDEFYVFGNTWRRTVLAQSANENGNLWNKVSVIPANNVYYEDSFITENADNGGNDTVGFTFTGDWETVLSGDTAGENREDPEHREQKPYGDVHGWTDDLADDKGFSDGSAHGTGLDGGVGAQATFTFTGTGVEVYTRTNADSGMVVAMLNKIDADGNVLPGTSKSIVIDNLARSGDYYHIPTVSFRNLVYGTYSVKLIATSAKRATDGVRTEYYVDGIRVYNPLGATTNYLDPTVQEAYALETNAVFTEVRDILLDNGSFFADTGEAGAVFIDWIQPDQGTGDDPEGEGVPSYEMGTFEQYGPKNEVYLSAGQAIVIKVAEGNEYFLGLKSLTGKPVIANISGVERTDPQSITLSHTVDQYYHVTPIDGYLVIQNGSDGDSVLSLTKLRATNETAPAENGGVLKVTPAEAVQAMLLFTRELSASPTVGDLDGSGEVDMDDATQLLLHLFFSERYAVNQFADFDGNGEMNVDDALYLLLHCSFPGDYPLA
ncbi:MAG: InlB B-repeat-containing protein [Clostridia bacterium]|nr:InlB B-repeat-containing protein [Clostridia bacterium]